MLLESPVGVTLGLAVSAAVFAGIYWDASRVDISRPLLWAAIAAGPIVVAAYLYLFVDTAPMTGVLLTANTGLVLYGFEREVVTDPDDAAEPGTLPHEK